jgi:hypothetical protein
MCCFSGPVRDVHDTQIFARPLPDGRQLLVYSMSVLAEQELAMVLPIPVPPAAPEDAVRFVDMSRCPTFFEQLDVLFPDDYFRGLPLGMPFGAAPQATPLVVHDVGSFEASFVPSIADFERLDPRFRLPSQVWDQLPTYRDWGFCVFKLRRGAVPIPEAPAERSVLQRVGDLFFGKPTPFVATGPSAGGAPIPYHPMAFEFPRRDPGKLFFPTLHIHSGNVEPYAPFDHSLYCQLEDRLVQLRDDWRGSTTSAGLVAGSAREWLDADARVFRRNIRGSYPNEDITVSRA